jgi:hypothetical protein
MTIPARAQLRELDSSFEREINEDKWVTVQFNPETLKVSFANQVTAPSGGDQNGPAARQFVGAGTTKLGLQLWFDVTSPLPEKEKNENDVRELTRKVAHFITPQKDPKDPKKFVPPAVRFLWGSFKFDGMMDSMEESLEFFSPEGRPLRASVTISLSQQKIQFLSGSADPERQARPAGPGSRTPGGAPLTQSKSGETLQGIAAGAGKAGNWQAIAAANGIENPRLLEPGRLINLNVEVGVRRGGDGL